ncbi:YcjF family protein [Pseudophaeobacter profundi]|uniref:YcjF family protein n=1 Tax=Pseudophaeobacter profundi TaxID=3034152 RepID=UPI00242D1198|nr:TIGR01620 family protein [Pseudophaeobacter profundi]
MSRKPVLFDLEADAESDAQSRAAGPEMPDVSVAPPVPDLMSSDQVGSGGHAAGLAARRPSGISRWFFGVVLALLGCVVSVSAWDFATGLLIRWPLVGWVVSAGLGLALFLALILALREFAALARLKRVDGLRRDSPVASADLAAAKAHLARLEAFYAGRPDMSWQLARLAERRAEVLDADTLLMLAEEELLLPLDARALQEVEAAARQVATVTALVPLALADVVVALLASVRMIRQVAQIYGGRSGLFSSWRLTRAVLAHLAATGAVAAGDDLLESVLGGSVLSKLSRRFGEGVVNGALSARVGIAAMEVCRPMPFSPPHRPSTRRVIQGALAGLFRRETGGP